MRMISMDECMVGSHHDTPCRGWLSLALHGLLHPPLAQQLLSGVDRPVLHAVQGNGHLLSPVVPAEDTTHFLSSSLPHLVWHALVYRLKCCDTECAYRVMRGSVEQGRHSAAHLCAQHMSAQQATCVYGCCANSGHCPRLLCWAAQRRSL